MTDAEKEELNALLVEVGELLRDESIQSLIGKGKNRVANVLGSA